MVPYFIGDLEADCSRMALESSSSLSWNPVFEYFYLPKPEKWTILGMPPGLCPILVEGDLDKESSDSRKGDFTMLSHATELSFKYMSSFW